MKQLRGSKEEVRRLRGQLEATGLSDTAMMGLLRGKDAALAAAGARVSALESAKVRRLPHYPKQKRTSLHTMFVNLRVSNLKPRRVSYEEKHAFSRGGGLAVTTVPQTQRFIVRWAEREGFSHENICRSL